MKLFKLIEIDLEKERARINKTKYTKHQRKVLHKLVDLFEQGKWQECLYFVNNKYNFPYNKNGEYPEAEHISTEISDVLHGVCYCNYYTKEQLLEEAKEILNNK